MEIINYNYNFDVKYFSIQKELLDKINSSKMNNEILEYDEDDVDLIIHKLYIDEILSVFKVSNFDNKEINKINNIIEKFFDIFIKNENNLLELENFKNIFFEKKNKELNLNFLFYNKINKNKINNNSNLLYFYNLFNFEYFHIFHRIIKNFYNNRTIDEKLLLEFIEI